MKIAFMVQRLGESRIDVVVDDEEGHRRKIQANWISRDADIPPDGWFEAVTGEVSYQRSEDKRKAGGSR